MTRSLRYMAHYQLVQLGIIAMCMVAFVPYAWLIGGAMEDSIGNYYVGMCYGMFVVSIFVFPVTVASVQSRMAIGFGATRKGWFSAFVLGKLMLGVVGVAMVMFLAVPLGALAFGDAGSLGASIAGQLRNAPLLLAISFVLASMAETLGYLMGRFTAKVGVIIMVLSIGCLCAIAGISVYYVGLDLLFKMANGPVLYALLLALALVFHAISWRFVRRLAA